MTAVAHLITVTPSGVRYGAIAWTWACSCGLTAQEHVGTAAAAHNLGRVHYSPASRLAFGAGSAEAQPRGAAGTVPADPAADSNSPAAPPVGKVGPDSTPAHAAPGAPPRSGRGPRQWLELAGGVMIWTLLILGICGVARLWMFAILLAVFTIAGIRLSFVMARAEAEAGEPDPPDLASQWPMKLAHAARVAAMGAATVEPGAVPPLCEHKSAHRALATICPDCGSSTW